MKRPSTAHPPRSRIHLHHTRKEAHMPIDWEQHSIATIAATVAALTTWG